MQQTAKRRGGCLFLGCVVSAGIGIILALCIGFYVWHYYSHPEDLLDIDSWPIRKLFTSIAPSIIEKSIDQSEGLSSEEKDDFKKAAKKVIKAIDDKKITSKDLQFLRSKIKTMKQGGSSSFSESDVDRLKTLFEKSELDLDDFPSLRGRLESEFGTQF